MSYKTIILPGGWSVWVGVDDDSHLNIEIKNTDGTILHSIGDEPDDGESRILLRYTSENIEDVYLKRKEKASNDQNGRAKD